MPDVQFFETYCSIYFMWGVLWVFFCLFIDFFVFVFVEVGKCGCFKQDANWYLIPHIS